MNEESASVDQTTAEAAEIIRDFVVKAKESGQLEIFARPIHLGEMWLEKMAAHG